MDALAFDFAPGRTGPPPAVGTRRQSFFGKRIPKAEPGLWATIVEKNWISNSAATPIESFVKHDPAITNFDQAVTQILCEGNADATYFLYFSGHGSPKIDWDQLSDQLTTSATSGSFAVDLHLSLPLLGELSVDWAQLGDWLAASVTSGSLAGNPHPSLSLCLHALHARQSVLTEAQAAALKRQLRVLLEDEEELPSANISVSIPSLHHLIDFLSVHQTSALPSLSITRAGYFAASWSPRKRAKLTLVFRPEGVADWIASDLNVTPPVHQKDILENRLGDFAAWANA
jgi:hypothetical protein